MFGTVGHPLQITENPSSDVVRSAVLAHDRVEPGLAIVKAPAATMSFDAK